jgi:osmotically-inducible protein OsmY
MISEFQTMRPKAERLLLNKLMEHGSLNIAKPGVRVQQGTAYIFGSVPNLIQKKLAGEIVNRFEGVSDVVNMLRVIPLIVIEDEDMKKHIRRALAKNPNIDESRLSVEVINGRVYLDGLASTAAEKRLVEQTVWASPGVRDIVNKIKVPSCH